MANDPTLHTRTRYINGDPGADPTNDQLYRLSENQVEDHELIRSLEHFSVLIFFWCLGLTVAVIALIL